MNPLRPLFALLTLGLGLSALAASPERLPRSTPEAEGVSSEAISRLVGKLEQRIDAVHSLMIVRHGRVIAEGWWAPYASTEPHTFFSLSKSFTSSAVGLAAAEGLLSIDDPVLKYFPEEAPANPSENLKEMRIRDLLKMSTGQHPDQVDRINLMGADPIPRQFLALEVPHKPGTLFYYNTPATYMLSAIVQKVSGRTVRDYLMPRLFEPLGFSDPQWQASAQGVSMGGFGLSARTEDIACFGQLLLQEGEWKGKRLLPRDWIRQATSLQASNGSNPDSDWDQGYGFQFWRCRNGVFRGDGAFGQFCIVMPQYDTVIAITSGTGDMGGVMNLLWSDLLPELRPAAIPANESAAVALRDRLNALSLPCVQGNPSSPLATSVSGKTYLFEANASGLQGVVMNYSDKGDTATVLLPDGSRLSVAIGHGQWSHGATLHSPIDGTPTPAALSGAWLDNDTYQLRCVYYRTPMILTQTYHFSGRDLRVELSFNVGFGKREIQVLTGHQQ